MFRLLRRWRSLPRDTRFSVIAFAITLAVMIAILVYLPPLLRGDLPLCRP